MNKIDIAIQVRLAQGDEIIPNFTRELTPDTGLRVGDIFTLPQQYEVLARRISFDVSQFILVVNQHEEVREFFPTQIIRKVGIYENGTFTGNYIQGQGTVNEHGRKFYSVAELMDSLKGKTIRVSRKTVVQSTYGPRSVFDLDFV